MTPFYPRIKRIPACSLMCMLQIVCMNCIAVQIIPPDKQHFHPITAKETVDLKPAMFHDAAG